MADDDARDVDYKERLTPEQYAVTRQGATERAFTGRFWDHHADGVYTCVCCGEPLFDSETKFESGTGWPSFYQPVDRAHIAYIEDRGHGMVRTEIRCARCGGHLGHVFPDGPPPARERYCLNSISMEFVDAGQPLPRKTRTDRAADPSRSAGG